jgi:dsDNA-binding SOS-regulon protein
MYNLSLMIRGGHVVRAIMPQDLADAYDEDPLKFGALLDEVLTQAPRYVVEDRNGRQVFVRSVHVVAWEVEADLM